MDTKAAQGFLQQLPIIQRWFPPTTIADILAVLPSAGPKTPLESVPVEILRCIVDFLPLDAAASLALCSRTLARTLGTQHWSAINRHRQQWDGCWCCANRWLGDGKHHRHRGAPCPGDHYGPRYEEIVDFFTHLQRDCPPKWLCYRCQRLHWTRNPCFAIPHDIPAQTYLHMTVLIGPYAITIGMLLRAASQLRLDDTVGATATLKSQPSFIAGSAKAYALDLEARLVEGQVVVRAQSWVEQASPFPRLNTADAKWCRSRQLTCGGSCGHGGYKQPRHSRRHHVRCPRVPTWAAPLPASVESPCYIEGPSHADGRSCRCWKPGCDVCTSHSSDAQTCSEGWPHCCDGRWRCASCPSEYELDFVPVPGYQTMMVTTVWRNFGRGHAVDDPAWRAQVLTDVRDVRFPPTFKDHGWACAGTGVVEPAEGFEQQQGTKAAELDAKMIPKALAAAKERARLNKEWAKKK